MKTYAIACGGTGGHIAPGIALAERLLERNNECILVVSKKEVDDIFLRKYANIRKISLSASPFSKQLFKFSKFLFTQTFSFFTALFFLLKNRINCVIGFGGFTSVPVVLAAFFLGKRIVLHESNRVIGKSIKLLSIFADVVYLPPEVKFQAKFLNKKVKNITCPVRREIFKFSQLAAKERLGISAKHRMILVLGGSQGAKILTNWAVENYKSFNKNNVCVYCISGSRAPKNFEINGNKFIPFCNDMNLLYNAADVIISRAGSGTISEAIRCQKKMILVPFKCAADGHQLANARYAEKLGYATCVEESEIGMLLAKTMDALRSGDGSSVATSPEIDPTSLMVGDIDVPQSIYMMGVCGAGMAPLAIYLSEIGFNVYGWDDFPDLNVKDMLVQHRVVFMPDRALPRKCDCVVVSSAINVRADDVCIRARKLELSVYRRGEFLARIIGHKKLLAIVGSHGKTSVCARIAQILASSGMHFDYLVGGFFKDSSVAPAKYHPDAEWVIAEVDESDCTIRNFSPEVTVALNYDDDHIVNYRGSEGLKATFYELFVRTKSKIYVTADDVIFSSMASQMPEKFSPIEDLPNNDFVSRNDQIAHFVVGDLFNVEGNEIFKFSGVKRRNDLMCKVGNITFLQDYAHHPTEIEAVLTYVRSHYPDHEITIVFQPHRVSRTKQYFEKFAGVLQKFDSIILVEVYCAFEERLGEISSRLIYDRLDNNRRLFVDDIENLGNELSGYCLSLNKNKEHLILFACAGDLLKYAKVFVDEYRASVIFKELDTDICSLNMPLGTKTTFGCNAIARMFVEPRSEEELLKILRLCRDLNLEYTILASGSNVVFPDGIYGKIVIKLTGEYWQQIEFLSEKRLRVYAGTKLNDLSTRAHEMGFDCLAFLRYIPGTVGGAVIMNAGAHGHSISEFVSAVCVLGGNEVSKILSNDECGFGYRSSKFERGLIIMYTELELKDSKKVCNDYKKVRQSTQPRGKTFGSIFKNPEGDYAGRLIEECGLKGYWSGDAVISEKHANFLINLGKASANDVEHVIDNVRYEVFDKFNVFLETEVLFLRK
ncbi:MAG: UDP-N-acetylmuramate dehydrogenase [Puniceicoccales bacterium]|jgi:UDP-N-acetylenolpyruvoylglucosamine reductase|nr:UDP-N-acetylmuramate dehydrogenase [Puniceicoccales bacterium]